MEMNEKEAVREPEEPKEELWDDLPHDSQHDELWEADGTELAVRQLMEQLKESDEKRTALQKKQLFFTRIFAVSNLVLAALVLLFVACELPGLTRALDQASGTLEQASTALTMAEDALDELGDVADNVNSLVDSSSLAVEQTMKKVDQMDIESLNEAISDLNDVIAPLAEFFGKFRK